MKRLIHVNTNTQTVPRSTPPLFFFPVGTAEVSRLFICTPLCMCEPARRCESGTAGVIGCGIKGTLRSSR